MCEIKWLWFAESCSVIIWLVKLMQLKQFIHQKMHTCIKQKHKWKQEWDYSTLSSISETQQYINILPKIHSHGTQWSEFHRMWHSWGLHPMESTHDTLQKSPLALQLSLQEQWWPLSPCLCHALVESVSPNILWRTWGQGSDRVIMLLSCHIIF